MAPRDPELWKQHLALHPPRACHHLRTGGCVATVATVSLCLPSFPSQKKKTQTQHPALTTRHGKSQAPDCRGGEETSPKVPPLPVPRGTRAPAGDPKKLFPCRLAAGVSSQTCSPSGAPCRGQVVPAVSSHLAPARYETLRAPAGDAATCSPLPAAPSLLPPGPGEARGRASPCFPTPAPAESRRAKHPGRHPGSFGASPALFLCLPHRCQSPLASPPHTSTSSKGSCPRLPIPPAPSSPPWPPKNTVQ